MTRDIWALDALLPEPGVTTKHMIFTPDHRTEFLSIVVKSN